MSVDRTGELVTGVALFAIGIHVVADTFLPGTTPGYCGVTVDPPAGGNTSSFDWPDGIVWEYVGIYPPEFHVQFYWGELQMSWWDGCEGYFHSMVPFLVGVALTVVAVTFLLHWHRGR